MNDPGEERKSGGASRPASDATEARGDLSAICDQFEAAWAKGPRPNLAKYLEQAREDLRPTLLQELLGIEIECRRKSHETIDVAEYAHRFPNYEGVVYGWFHAHLAGDDAAEPMIREYRLLESLGEGGMGKVYKAEHSKLKRMVAVKVLTAGSFRRKEAIARFERETAAVGRLHHPNIVGATDAGTVGDTYFLVMEYLDGIDLGQVVARLGALSIPNAAELIRQSAEGLQHAHAHELVHRDVKPSNLMLTRDGVVKLLDLGLARVRLEDTVEEISMTGQMMGTLDYMAPEQLDDSRVDARADIYGLGATFYKLLCGEAPLEDEKTTTPSQKIKKLITGPVPRIEGRRPDIPPELAGIVGRMLAKSPDDRYQSMADVIVALEPFCRGSDPVALVERCLGGAATTGETAPAAVTTLETPGVMPFPGVTRAVTVRERSPHRGWSRKQWLAGLAAGVIAVAAARYFSNRPPRELTPTDPPESGQKGELAAGSEEAPRTPGGTGEAAAPARGKDRFLVDDETVVVGPDGRTMVISVEKETDEPVTVSVEMEPPPGVTAEPETRETAEPPAAPLTAAEATRLRESNWEKIGQGSVQFLQDKVSQSEKVKVSTHRGDVLLVARHGAVRQDCDVSVSYRAVSGDTELGFGLVFGYRDEGNYHSFHVQTGKQFRLVQWIDGKPWQLVPWTPSSLLRPVYTIQRMRLVVKGNDVFLSIDDQQIGAYKLASPPAGRIGLYVSEPGFSVDFWDLQVN